MMPRRRRGIALTWAQEDDLMLGGPPADWSEAERRRAWRQHRDELMATHGGPGHRLAAWWRYDAGDDAPCWVGDREMRVSDMLAFDVAQLRYLAEHDMDAEEAAEVVRLWLPRAEGGEPRAPAVLAAIAEFFPAIPQGGGGDLDDDDSPA